MSPPRLWAAALVLTASACTIHTTSDDAGATDAAPQTVGDQCAEIAREFCQQASRCPMPLGSPLDQCISSGVAACCVGSMCNAQSQSPSAAIRLCQQAIDAEQCYPLSTGVTPDACLGLPKMP